MKQVSCDYENDGTRIRQPGKFEGEPIFAPYFWDLAIQGFSDNDDGHTFSFRFNKEDFQYGKPFARELKQWLGRKRSLKMFEDGQGFVHCQ